MNITQEDETSNLDSKSNQGQYTLNFKLFYFDLIIPSLNY